LTATNGGETTLPLIATYGTERLWFEKSHYKDRSSGEALRSRFDGYTDCFEFTIQDTVFKEWFRDQSNYGSRETVGLTAVKTAIKTAIDSVRDVLYDSLYPKDLVIDLQAQGPCLLRHLSDGQRIMLTMVGDLARRSATLNPHLGADAVRLTPGVVLIDELDLHLHPKWQRIIISRLKNTFPAVQFVATTHSPQLIGEAKPEEIRILSGDSTWVPPRSFGMDSSRVLEELMDTTSRDVAVEELISNLAAAINREDFLQSRKLLSTLADTIGASDPEVTRAKALLAFLQPGV
jgi:predicted ATP-binding protein involved in virulence